MKFLLKIWIVSLLLALPNFVYSQSLREFFSNRTELNRDDLPNSTDGTDELSFNEVICKDKKLFPIKLYSKKCLPNTILFQGLEGIGKYTFVLHLINSIKSFENTSNLETILSNDNNILILKKNESSREYKFDEIKKDVVKFVKENPKWSVSLQTHKYLEID